MPNFIDYTKYYGDKSFEEVPFNDIDALILAELSYLNLSDVSDEFPNTIEKISKSYYSSGRFGCPQRRIRRRKSLRSQAGGRGY